MTTVLVVHCEEGTAVWLKNCLEAAGFRVITARDGPTALDLVRRARPALVLLDLMSPAPAGCSDDDAGGAEMGCEFLRRLRCESNVGVIVLSHRDDQEIKVAALESGADDYLTRPFSPAELLARIHAVLRRVERYKRATPNLDIDKEAPPDFTAE